MKSADKLIEWENSKQIRKSRAKHTNAAYGDWLQMYNLKFP